MALENDTRQSPEEALAEGSAQTDAILAELLGGGGAGGGEPEGGDAEPEPGGDEPEDDGTTEDAPEADAAPEGDSEAEEGDDTEPEPLDAADDAPAGSIGELRGLAAGKKWAEFFSKLGLKPEDLKLDTAGWTNWRKANDAERRKLREQEQEVTQKLTGWRDQLLSAQGQLEQRAAKLKEGEARIAKYVQAEEAFRKDGDPTHLVELVEAVSEVPFDEANRMILHKIRRTPGERALAKRLEEEARKREELEQRLAQQQQAPQASEQEQAERDHKLVDAHVDAGVRSGDLSADVKKVPHYRERIRQFVNEKDPHDPKATVHRFAGFETVSPGKLSALEYDQSVADLVAFLQWMGEPSQGKRLQIGVWVLMFLAVFTVLAWRLNAAFWKDVK
jgi:cytochrome c1